MNRNDPKRLLRLLLSTALATVVTAAHPAEPAAAAASAPPRYTFAWPMDAGAAKPRGGTTHGAPVARDLTPSAAWTALQAPGLSTQERDRRAILAMAGTYRVTFDFLEIDSYPDTDARPAPYQSWSTEKVYVDKDEPGFVSLVHILEMRFVAPDGSVGTPMVTKHWRQDWAYQPATIVEYQGRDRWRKRAVSAADRRGAWTQTVFQVDESPRYAGIGRWQHTGSFSTWISGDTWRPLPRREWSVRDDYQVLTGTNRHTVQPTGWTQEENNLKTVLAAGGAVDPARPFLAREYGVARYDRIRDADFAMADAYYDHTRSFWDQVRDTWSTAFDRRGLVALRGPVDKLGLFAPLFARADQIDEDPAAHRQADDAAVIDAALAEMGVGR